MTIGFAIGVTVVTDLLGMIQDIVQNLGFGTDSLLSVNVSKDYSKTSIIKQLHASLI